jgi:hypothetical protein
MNIKYYLLAILTFSFTVLTHAQNHILNPGFEDSTPDKHWTTSYTYCNYPENMNVCSKAAPYNNVAAINFDPIDGKNCISINLFGIEVHWSDYLINNIIPLQKGAQYAFSFYITPDDSCGYYVKNIDALFCNSKYLKQNISCTQPQKIYVEPTLSFDISGFKKNGQEGKWIKLSGTFIAGGNENILVIGNFTDDKKYKYYFKRDLSYKTTKQFRIENFGGADYYLDNFSLTIIDSNNKEK